jgi:uncharacterized protein YhaN
VIVEWLHIDAFGSFRDYGLPAGRITPGINVLYGVNESGKTTLLDCAKWLLFGKSKGTRIEARPPIGAETATGRMGVRLRDGSRLQITRSTAKQAMLSVTDEQGRDALPLLERALEHCTPEMYESVFAFGLDELADRRRLEKGDVSRPIFSAMSGLGGTDIEEIRGRLEEEMEGIFLPTGRKKTRLIEESRQELARVREGLRHLHETREQYDELLAEEEWLEARQAALALDRGAKEERLRAAQRTAKALPDYRRLTALRRKLDGLPEIPGFPADAVGQFTRLAERETALEGELREKRALFADLEGAAAPMGRADEIEKVLSNAQAIRNVRTEMEEMSTAIEQGERRIATLLQRLPGDMSKDAAVSFDTSAEVRAEVAEIERALRAAERQRDIAQSGATRATKAADEARRAHEGAKAALPRREGPAESREGLEEQRARVRELRSAVAQRDSLAGQVRRLRDQMEARKREAEVRATPDLALLLGPALVAALGVVWAVTGNLVAGLAVVAIGIVAGAALWLRGRARFRHAAARAEEATREAQALQAELDTLGKEEAGARTSADDLAAHLGLGGSPTAADVESSAGDLDRLWQHVIGRESAVQREQELAGAANRAAQAEQEARKALVDAEAAVADAERAWARWLEQRGLPGDFRVEAADGLLNDCEKLAADEEGVRARKARLGEQERQVREFDVELGDVVTRVGLADTGDADANAELLRTRLDEARKADRERRALEERIKGLQGDLSECRTRISKLLEAARAGNDTELRQNAAKQEERRKLAEEVAGLVVKLSATMNMEDEQELSAYLEAREQEDEEAAARTLEADLQKDGEEGEANFRRLGEIKTQLADLTRGESVAALRGEEQRLLERLAAAAHEWAVRAVSLNLLDRTQRQYEEEKQPAVLRHATRYFERVTRGHYREVLARLGETEIKVRDDAGRTWEADKLSRGTREQLFLAVRLGYLSELAEKVEPLPVIMDDIFVNFDNERARLYCETLGELAETHQVLCMTCRREVAEMFTEVHAGAANIIELPAF